MYLVEYQALGSQVNHKPRRVRPARENLPAVAGNRSLSGPARSPKRPGRRGLRGGTISAVMQGMNLTRVAKDLLRFSPLLLVLGPACAMSPPAQNAGSLASEGVQVAVVGQRCAETVETDWPGANLVETTVQFQVRNSNPNPVTVNREQLYLRGTDGRAVRSRGWEAGQPVQVGSGETRTFDLQFMTRGGMSCSKPMQLDAAAGISVGSQPLRIGSVTFVPSKV